MKLQHSSETLGGLGPRNYKQKKKNLQRDYCISKDALATIVTSYMDTMQISNSRRG